MQDDIELGLEDVAGLSSFTMQSVMVISSVESTWRMKGRRKAGSYAAGWVAHGRCKLGGVALSPSALTSSLRRCRYSAEHV